MYRFPALGYGGCPHRLSTPLNDAALSSLNDGPALAQEARLDHEEAWIPTIRVKPGIRFQRISNSF